MTYLLTWFVALLLGIAIGYARGRIDGSAGLAAHLVRHGHLTEPLAGLVVRSWERRWWR